MERREEGGSSKGMRRPVRALAFRDVNKEVTTFFVGGGAAFFFSLLEVMVRMLEILILWRGYRGGCRVH